MVARQLKIVSQIDAFTISATMNIQYVFKKLVSGCAGCWSAPLLFASNKVRVSCVEAHMILMPRLPGLRLAMRLLMISPDKLKSKPGKKKNPDKEIKAPN